MRPSSIVTFGWLYLASLALGVLTYVIGWDAFLEILERDAGVGPGDPIGSFLIISIGVIYVGYLVLWYWTARRHAHVAKWMLVTLLLFDVIALWGSIAAGAPMGLLGIISILAKLTFGAAVALLFMPDSNAWFRGEYDGDTPTRDA